MSLTRRFFLGGVLACSLAACSAGGPPGTEQQQVVSQAAATIERLRTDQNLAAKLAKELPKARAVLIVPELVKAGFLIGGEYGTGVLMIRSGRGWTSPAFYSVSSGSLGLQAGVQDSEVIFLINTQKGLDSLLSSNFKMGVDASVAVATVGAGIEGSTTGNMGADIVAYSHASGLFGGGAFEGAVVKPRDSWNQAYYGPGIGAGQIIAGKVNTPKAERLKQLLDH